MGDGEVVIQELCKLFGVLSHRVRVMIIEELAKGEKDVNSLKDILSITQTSASQQLAVLRANRLVEERREGRHVYYHLTQPGIAKWIGGALRFLERDISQSVELSEAVSRMRTRWDGETSGRDKPNSDAEMIN